jgi:ParB family chromosome partitioning protein
VLRAPVVAVNPFRCRMWDLHDRLETHVSAESCRAEIESFSKHGQLVPVLGRKLHGDPSYEFELIYGARRLFVARHINKPLLVEVSELSDRNAIVAMDIENRQRRDISPYERSLSYAKWVRAGFFASQEDLARALHVSPSQVSRLLQLARLPAVLVNAFDNPNSIRENWGLKLIQALDDPQTRQPTVRRARELARVEPRAPAREVYRQLLAAPLGGAKVKRQTHDEVVTDSNAVPLFRIRHHRSTIAVLLPISRTSAKSLGVIRELLRGVLELGPGAHVKLDQQIEGSHENPTTVAAPLTGAAGKKIQVNSDIRAWGE